MPWIKGDRGYPNTGSPSRYTTNGIIMTDDVVLGRPFVVEYAKNHRKSIGQIREGLVAAQKECGREDRENARYLGQESAELMKQWRGWDACIRRMEGLGAEIQEDIAPYVDRAFMMCDLAWGGK